MVELVLAGRTYQQIGAAVGANRSTVANDIRCLRAEGFLPASAHQPQGDGTTPLAEARRAGGLTRRTLAERAGVAPGRVIKAEHGRVHRDTAAALAAALGRPLVVLFPEFADLERPAVPPPATDDDETWARRRRIAELHAQDLTPAAIATAISASRSTVYRDIDALRDAGWVIPPRPMGRPPRRRDQLRPSAAGPTPTHE